MEEEIKTIEYTLRNIFNKDEITSDDVSSANALFEKWKVLKNYTEDIMFPIQINILDEKPLWQTN